MSKHYRYQVLVRTSQEDPTLVLTDVIHSSFRAVSDWISDNECYDGQYTYQRFYGSIPDRVLGMSQIETRDASGDPLHPASTLLIKLGSIMIHADEFLSSWGHEFDRVALEGLINDPEVKQWAAEMDGMAFLPKKRN